MRNETATDQLCDLREFCTIIAEPDESVQDNGFNGFDVVRSRNDQGHVTNGLRVSSVDPNDTIQAVSVMAIKDGRTVASASYVGTASFDLIATAIVEYRKL